MLVYLMPFLIQVFYHRFLLYPFQENLQVPWKIYQSSALLSEQCKFNYSSGAVSAGGNVFELDAVLSGESSQADIYVCIYSLSHFLTNKVLLLIYLCMCIFIITLYDQQRIIIDIFMYVSIHYHTLFDQQRIIMVIFVSIHYHTF